MTAAQPFPLVRRIPEDQPFVVRHSLRKRGLLMGSVVAVVDLLLLCVFGLAVAGGGDSGKGMPVPVAVFVFLAVTLMLVLFFGAFLLLLTSGGPVLAAGPAGLWIRTRPTFGQAVWLPWEEVLLISRRRWGLEKMLVVRPRHRRIENLGRFTAFDASVNRAFYNGGFTATLNLADRPEPAILQAVAYYAANRVPLT